MSNQQWLAVKILLHNFLPVSILEDLYNRTEKRLRKPANDSKLGEAALEDGITANTELNKSETSPKNDQLVLGGQQQNTVFCKNNLWHEHTIENNRTIRRKSSKSQVHQEYHQHNTTAKIHLVFLVNPYKKSLSTAEC